MPKDKKPVAPKPTKKPAATNADLAALDRGLRSGNAEAEEVKAMRDMKKGKKPTPAKFNKGGKVCAPKGKK